MWVSRECLRDCHAMSDLCYLIVNAIYTYTHTYTMTMGSRIQLENWFSPNRASSTVYESTIIEALRHSRVPYSICCIHARYARVSASWRPSDFCLRGSMSWAIDFTKVLNRHANFIHFALGAAMNWNILNRNSQIYLISAKYRMVFCALFSDNVTRVVRIFPVRQIDIILVILRNLMDRSKRQWLAWQSTRQRKISTTTFYS